MSELEPHTTVRFERRRGVAGDGLLEVLVEQGKETVLLRSLRFRLAGSSCPFKPPMTVLEGLPECLDRRWQGFEELPR